jgi:hypothetical protein
MLSIADIRSLENLKKICNIHELTAFSVANVADPLGSGLDTFQHTEQPSQQPSYQNCCSDRECRHYLEPERNPKLATAPAAVSSYPPQSPLLQRIRNSSHRKRVPSHSHEHAAMPNGGKKPGDLVTDFRRLFKTVCVSHG